MNTAKYQIPLVTALLLSFQLAHATFIVAEKLQGVINGHIKTAALLGDMHTLHPADNAQFELITKFWGHPAVDFLIEGTFSNPAIERTIRGSAESQNLLLRHLAIFGDSKRVCRNIDTRAGAFLISAALQHAISPNSVTPDLFPSRWSLAIPGQNSQLINRLIIAGIQNFFEGAAEVASSSMIPGVEQLDISWAARDALAAHDAILHWNDGVTANALYRQELALFKPTFLGRTLAPTLSKLMFLMGGSNGSVPFGMTYPIRDYLERFAHGEPATSIIGDVAHLPGFARALNVYTDKIFELTAAHEILNSSQPKVVFFTGAGHIQSISCLLLKLGFQRLGEQVIGEHALRLLEVFRNTKMKNVAAERESAEPLAPETINELLANL